VREDFDAIASERDAAIARAEKAEGDLSKAVDEAIDDIDDAVDDWMQKAAAAERARDEVGIQLAACQERLRLAERCAGHLRTAIADGVIIDARAIDALAALDAVPGDALAGKP
jgi:hypothetical protein